MAEALELTSWVRQMRVSAFEETTPVAWSAVDMYNDSRLYAGQYAACGSGPLPFGDPITMYYVPFEEREAYEAELLQMLETAEYVVATINLAGPIIFEQRFLLPDGQVIPNSQTGSRPTYAFAFRAMPSPVINVEGELRVIDLSMGNEPLAVEDWMAHLVDSSTPCVHGDYDTYWDAWTFWLAVLLNYPVGPEPQHECVYTFTPALSRKVDGHIVIDSVASAPSQLITQFNKLRNLVVGAGHVLSDDEIAQVLTEYTPHTLDWWCQNFYKLDYCKSGGKKGGRQD
jgi:hypothetical protein